MPTRREFLEKMAGGTLAAATACSLPKRHLLRASNRPRFASAIFGSQRTVTSLAGLRTTAVGCDTWVALPDATADHSVLLAKNSDRPPMEAQVLVKFPPPAPCPG
jgi:hypothetical protein